MSLDSIRNQHAELNRMFEEHYDELSGIDASVKEALQKLVAENDVSEEMVAWALSSLDIRARFVSTQLNALLLNVSIRSSNGLSFL